MSSPEQAVQEFHAAALDPAGWIEEHGVTEVEVLVPDLNGILRGKRLPAAKFLKVAEGAPLYMPTSVLLVGLDGRYCGARDEDFAYRDPDLRLVPDNATLRLLPGEMPGRAVVFADTLYPGAEPWRASPRALLKSVVELYAAQGWRAVVAPELEFYMVAANPDPAVELVPPVTAAGRGETAQHPYDMAALDAFDPIVARIYDRCASAGVALDALTHETGSGQLEINLLHGHPLGLADQVMLFKRIARQAALESGVNLTFMAKPIASQAGSSMHLHLSLVGPDGANLFAAADGSDSQTFVRFIGGLQRYLPEAMPLVAPSANSFRRIRPTLSAPANVEWSRDNRSCGLRVPQAVAQARRIENRLPGADANPYLAIAATMLCGYLGVVEGIERSAEAGGNAYRARSTLPRSLGQALDRLAACRPILDLLGPAFCDTFLHLKAVELNGFESVVTAWEREHLLGKA